MKAHVFYFKYPRLQEDLVHQVIEDLIDSPEVQALPLNSYIYYEGRWYLRHRRTDKFNRFISAVVHDRILDAKVPAEIRTHLLLLT